eukprot:7523518-Lingulodinium_polyedra.AAC.1
MVVESGIRNRPGDRIAHLRLMQYVKAHASGVVCASSSGIGRGSRSSLMTSGCGRRWTRPSLRHVGL